MKKFVSLLSGGLDSPIASYLMMKKNLSPVFISFLTSDDENNSMRTKVIQIVKKLSEYTSKKLRLYFINHDPNLDLLIETCERKLTCVLCKRLMIKIAREIGKIEGTNIIVTGDILGEQASQTLDNLYTYNDILKEFVLLRPLIGKNKAEIIKLNQELGLYEITSISSAACQYNPQYPETHAKTLEVKNEESRFKITNLVKNSLQRAEILDF